MSTVRAKFRVDRIEYSMGAKTKLDGEGKPMKNERGYVESVPCKMATIHLLPVYANGDPNHENTKFWQSSPSGKIELGCVNAEATKAFNIGQEFYIDFTPATEPPVIE